MTYSLKPDKGHQVSSLWFLCFYLSWPCSYINRAHSLGFVSCRIAPLMLYSMGFPYNSVSKESACNAGDPSSIPGSGKSTREGVEDPLQYSWASLVAQLIKNLPAMKETWVQSLGWEDPLEKEKATHSSILAWRIPWTVQHSCCYSLYLCGLYLSMNNRYIKIMD